MNQSLTQLWPALNQPFTNLNQSQPIFNQPLTDLNQPLTTHATWCRHKQTGRTQPHGQGRGSTKLRRMWLKEDTWPSTGKKWFSLISNEIKKKMILSFADFKGTWWSMWLVTIIIIDSNNLYNISLLTNTDISFRTVLYNCIPISNVLVSSDISDLIWVGVKDEYQHASANANLQYSIVVVSIHMLVDFSSSGCTWRSAMVPMWILGYPPAGLGLRHARLLPNRGSFCYDHQWDPRCLDAHQSHYGEPDSV